eukprot:2832951-Alexandrium_andersonii.AAC.1
MVGLGELRPGLSEAGRVGRACQCGRGPVDPAGVRLWGPACRRGRGPVESPERPARPGQRP